MRAATTLLITPFCPLHCRYCNLDTEMAEAIERGNHGLTYEEMDEKTSIFLKENPNAEYYTMTITGGEPFVRWPDIKKLITKYGDKITFDFNTSGYLLTEEIIEWLSHYKVTWNLSVDGGEKVTNYLRPLRNPDSTNKTYFQKLKEIVPVLTYYFPNVYCKIIISKRLIPDLYQSYLELEQIGFRKMFLILDLQEREDEKHEGTWTDKDFVLLQSQLNKIADQIAIGMKHGVYRLRVAQIDEIVYSLLNPTPVSPYNLACGILDVRNIFTMFDDKEQTPFGTCYEGLKLTKGQFQSILEAKLIESDGKCANDKDCPFFGHCGVRTCTRDNLSIRGNPWAPEMAFCMLMKVCGYAALNLLNRCNNECPDSREYQTYLSHDIGIKGES